MSHSRLATLRQELGDLLQQEHDQARELERLREEIRQTRLQIASLGGRF
jgi:chromosome segregation ATPase